MAALICGGETPKLAAICGSEVEMIEESRPSMKKAPATTTGTMRENGALGGSRLTACKGLTEPIGMYGTYGACPFRRQAVPRKTAKASPPAPLARAGRPLD